MANFLNINYEYLGKQDKRGNFVLSDGLKATLVNIDTINKIELTMSNFEENKDEMKVYFKDGTEIVCDNSNSDEFNSLLSCSSIANVVDIDKIMPKQKDIKQYSDKMIEKSLNKLIFSNYIIAIIILIGLLCTH